MADLLEQLLCDAWPLVSPHGADTVVIAGMGGETIVHIWPPRTGRIQIKR